MKPRVLFWDIETSPNIGYTWAKWEQNVIEFVSESQLLSVAWKWQGDDKVQVASVNNMSEKLLLKLISGVLNSADMTVAHNGDAFDVKKFNTRLAYYELPALKKVPTFDTKKQAKKYFMFNSNSLDDLGKFLGIGRKYKHSGFQLWIDCMAGKNKAFKEMEKYNKKDVKLLERVYRHLLPFCTSNTVVRKLGLL